MKNNIQEYRYALISDLIRAEELRGSIYSIEAFANKFKNFKADSYDWPEDEKWEHKEFLSVDHPTVLTLDLGTSTGWAIRNSNGPIESGTINFKNTRFEGGGMRFLKFERFLNKIDESHDIQEVYFEEVRQVAKGVDASHIYGGFLANLTCWCEARNIPYEGVPVGTIKIHATGKGNAPKSAMIESAKRRGHNPETDDEADALAILYWALGNRLPHIRNIDFN